MPDFQTPEIQVVPVEEVVLKLKSYGVLDVASFPWITKPHFINILEAEDVYSFDYFSCSQNWMHWKMVKLRLLERKCSILVSILDLPECIIIYLF